MEKKMEKEIIWLEWVVILLDNSSKYFNPTFAINGIGDHGFDIEDLTEMDDWVKELIEEDLAIIKDANPSDYDGDCQLRVKPVTPRWLKSELGKFFKKYKGKYCPDPDCLAWYDDGEQYIGQEGYDENGERINCWICSRIRD